MLRGYPSCSSKCSTSAAPPQFLGSTLTRCSTNSKRSCYGLDHSKVCPPCRPQSETLKLHPATLALTPSKYLELPTPDLASPAKISKPKPVVQNFFKTTSPHGPASNPAATESPFPKPAYDLSCGQHFW